jgi:ESS family glutamate:Na+ symporter
MYMQSFAGLCLLLLAGKLLRVKIRFFQKLYLPSSVIGGILGLVILTSCGQWIDGNWTAGWSKLPGILINIVFAALFLGVAIPPLKKIFKQAAPQLAYGQIVAWGQYVVGMGLVVLLLSPLFGVSRLFGVIVPVGFEGGHGTAGGLGPTFAELGWSDGLDFGLASATIGLVAAVLVGISLVNWAARKGHVTSLQTGDGKLVEPSDGLYPPDGQPVAGRHTAMPESVDSLALNLAVIGISVLIGFVIKQLLIWIEGSVLNVEQEIMRAFPLFPLCMLGGLIVQLVLTRTAKKTPVDRGLMQRLAGLALDFLVVAAISTMRMEVISRGLLPLAIIVAGGIAWNVFCVMWLARRMLPDAWFERSIAEMGQSMGVTATGLLLLRIVDPEQKTNAHAAFGYKQLLHEPFMGGGLWTSFALIFAFKYGALPVLAVSMGAIVVWLIVWAIFMRPKRGA